MQVCGCYHKLCTFLLKQSRGDEQQSAGRAGGRYPATAGKNGGAGQERGERHTRHLIFFLWGETNTNNFSWYQDLWIISVLLAAKVIWGAYILYLWCGAQWQVARLSSQRVSVKSDESPTFSSGSACASDRLGLMFAGAEKNGRSHGNRAEEAQRWGRRPAYHSGSPVKGTQVLTNNVFCHLEEKRCFKMSSRWAHSCGLIWQKTS